MPAFFTVEQVAERWGQGNPTVLSVIHSGELRAMNLGKSAKSKKPRWRIREADLIAFEQSRENKKPNIAAVKLQAVVRKPDSEVVKFFERGKRVK